MHLDPPSSRALAFSDVVRSALGGGGDKTVSDDAAI
jgi:hypothetical protein